MNEGGLKVPSHTKEWVRISLFSFFVHLSFAFFVHFSFAFFVHLSIYYCPFVVNMDLEYTIVQYWSHGNCQSQLET